MTDLDPTALVLVKDLQPRGGEDPDHVNDIAETLRAGKKLKHRVLVVQLTAPAKPEGYDEPFPIGTHLVCDGFHTVRAARKANHETGKARKVPCSVFPGTWKDALLAAATGNAHHWPPLKLKPDAKRRMVEMYLQAYPRASLTDVEEACHVSRPLVVDVRRAMRGEPAGGNVTTPAAEPDAAETDGEGVVATPPEPPKPAGKPAPRLVDWVEGEALYGKLRRFCDHVAEVHGDVVDKADRAALGRHMTAAFDAVFATGATPPSWKTKVLKQRGK